MMSFWLGLVIKIAQNQHYSINKLVSRCHSLPQSKNNAAVGWDEGSMTVYADKSITCHRNNTGQKNCCIPWQWKE